MKNSIFLFFLVSAIPAFAQNWTGAVSSDWNNPANWSSAPSTGDDIVIDPANYTGIMANPVIAANSSFTPAEMLVQGGAVLAIQANLSTSDRVEVLGAGTTVIITSGTFAVNGPGNNARLVFADDSHLQMDGGALIAGQRLLFELGATGELNVGTITVGETFALVDGGVTGSSTFVQNGGTMTVNAEMGFENEAGEFYPLFLQTGGQLNVNGSLLWLGAAPGSGRGYFRSVNGLTTVTGAIGNDPTSTMNAHIELAGNAQFDNAGAAVTLLAGDSIVLAENATWNDEAGAVWQNAGVVHGNPSTMFYATANSQIYGPGSYRFGSVRMTMTHHSPAEIFVSGDIWSGTTFVPMTNRVVLDGTAQQFVEGGIFYDLTVNNPAGLQTESLWIGHELDMTDGMIEVLGNHVITVEDDATVVNASETHFIDGAVNKYGNEAFTFPVGALPDRYRPLTITAPVSAATQVRCEYIFDAYGSPLPVEAPLQAVSVVEYWDLSRTGSTDLVGASVAWNNAAQSGLTDCADVSLAVRNGAQWAFVPSVTSGQCDGTNAGSVASTTDLPVIDDIILGFTEAVTQQVFELCFYETATVGSNTYDSAGVYIDILQDSNGNDSTVVSTVSYFPAPDVGLTAFPTYLDANGTNYNAQHWVDCNNGYQEAGGVVMGGNFYPAANGSYALVVTTFGCSDTSDCYEITVLGLEEEAAQTALIWPNPVKAGDWLNIQAVGLVVEVRIFAADGREVAAPELQTTAEGARFLPLGLAAGSYQLLIRKEDGASETQRLLVE